MAQNTGRLSRGARASAQQARNAVLIAADVPYSRTLLKQRLTQMGYQVSTVDSMVPEIQQLTANHQLVIVDMSRSAGASEQFLLRLRVNGCPVPVLLMLQNVEFDILQRLTTLRPVGFLTKPLRMEVLTELIDLAIKSDPNLLRRSAELAVLLKRQSPEDGATQADVIDRAVATRNDFDEHQLKRLFGSLPLLPHVVAQVIQISGSETAVAADLANVISSDPRLSGQLLRVVNSAFFGFARRISTIPEATVILGIDAIKNLTVGAAVANFFGGKSDLVDRGRLWRHSLAAAAASRALARHLGYHDVEEAFAAGLLHDFGRLVLERYLPQHYRGALVKAREEQIDLLEAEKAALGVHHAWVSGWLAKQWNLPAVLRESMAFHHEPELAEVSVRGAVALVHLADRLVHRAGMGGVEGVPELGPPSTYAVESFSTSLDSLLGLVPEILSHAKDLEQQLSSVSKD